MAFATGSVQRCGNVITRRALFRLITESMDNVMNDDEEEDVLMYYLRTMLKSVEQKIEDTRNTDSR